jgi:cytoskeleton protein RodZ
MTESSTVSAAGAAYAPSPGALLRRARQAQGLHIAALAAALKVNPRKLELLEGDQYDELPDVAFARALAQAVCRHLKIEAQPVLALLPVAATAQPALERVTMGLNTPFREHAQRHEASEWPAWLQFRIVGPILLVLAAGVVLVIPSGWLSWLPQFSLPWSTSSGTSSSGAEPVSDTPAGMVTEQVPLPSQSAVVMGSGADTVVEPAVAPVAGAASQPAAAASGALQGAAGNVIPQLQAATALAVSSSAPLPAGMLALRSAKASWVEVIDGAGDTLISRHLAPGETVALNGVAPLRLTVGNAEGMQVRFKGRMIPLSVAPDHTARTVLP